MTFTRSFAFGLAALGGSLAAQGPQSAVPSGVGIDYRIVAVRMPRAATPANEVRENFPDAANHSLYVARGADLVLIHPDGSETMLVDASAVVVNGQTHANASCVDPFVAYDATHVYFSWFQDPHDFNTQRDLSKQPAHIMKVHIVSGVVTQLTTGSTIQFADTGNAVNPQYAKFDVAPLVLADGRILFLSNREGLIDVMGKMPAMRFYRMEADGSNVEAIENFTQGTCEHPWILQDGRVVWTHLHTAGRRTTGTGTYPLMIANPDMSDWKTFAGVHTHDAAYHFTGQMGNGDVVTTAYYHFNNFGFGTILRMPLTVPGQVQHFAPKSVSPLTYNPYGWSGHAQPAYANGNDHFARLGETVSTPWSHNPGASIAYDNSSPFITGYGHAGKATMPAGAPNGHMLFVYSPGEVNGRNQWEPPHMKVGFLANGTSSQLSNVVVIKESALHHYLYPKPVVRYVRIHGISAPGAAAEVANDGSLHPTLPAGTPFAVIGTSSVYNRESDWPSTYTDEWDVNSSNNYALYMAFRAVGQDRLPFPNSRIHAAQVVADMSHVDSRYSTLTQKFKTHNNGSQIWGVLGEIPLRKYGSDGQPLLDTQGNPDTSYQVRVPADVPVHNRIIDQLGLTLTEEATWHSPRPGEMKNNCAGCHAHSTNTVPLPFAGTLAASMPITDFALQTPLVSVDSSGNPTVVVEPSRIKIVEFFQHIRPLLDQHCTTCHGNTSPAADLDLHVDQVGSTFTDNVYDRLAYTGPTPVPPGVLHPTWKEHQATRWVRKNAAAQSQLVWKAYGRRLDGRTDGARANDVDFGPSHPTTLTFDQKRLFAMWVDLGCLVDIKPDTVDVWDCKDDQMRPTLTTQGIDWNNATAPLPMLNVGVFDVHSGIKPGSLQVTVTNLTTMSSSPHPAPSVTVDGGVYQVDLSTLAAGTSWRIDIRVEDNFVGTSGHGNIARVSYTVHL